MKEYYPSKNRLFVVFMPAAMLFLLAFNTFSLNNIAALSVSLVTFGILGYGLFILFKRMSRPILVIENSKITVNTWFSNNVITDLEQCKLIISNDFVAFREFQKQDVSIAKDDIPKDVWTTLLKDLQSLHFKEVVK